jgi:Leucine-rich repeat (LRR) protein
MACVSQHRWLRRLDLSHNQIAHIEGLEACAALEELSLSHNRVRRIQGLSSLHMLRRLDLV